MSNPWLKKNPLLSMWLSGVNGIAGTIRGHATAQARRQVNAAMTEAARTNNSIWSAVLNPPSSKARKKRKR
jgi:hypothetical protein